MSPAPPAPHPARRPAIVTGASSGIGRATALALAGAGHPVALGARRTERLEELASEIVAAGGEAVALHLDLLDAASVASFVRAATAALGDLEVVVSNAGDVQPVDVAGDPAVFERQLAVNLLGPQRLLHEVVPAMVGRGRGDVGHDTPVVASPPRPHVAGYVASKAGLEAMGRALQMELEGTGVRAGMVRPGPAATEAGSDWDGDAIGAIVPSWQRWGLLRHSGMLAPADVAAAVLAVVSAPPGGQLAIVEVQPTAPVRKGEQ